MPVLLNLDFVTPDLHNKVEVTLGQFPDPNLKKLATFIYYFRGTLTQNSATML